MKAPRDLSLDTLRGLAIFLMVQSNIAASIFPQPFPEFGRAYVKWGSFVPALFILLAGMMVVYTSQHKSYTLRHYMLRMTTLFVTAAVVLDVVIFRVVPFLGVDVLYLIGLSLPLSYLFQRLPGGARWLIVAVVFLVTPWLQSVFGYTPYPTEFTIFGKATGYSSANETGVLNHWFLDGWFPIFPWVGFALLGVNLGRLRWGGDERVSFARLEVVAIGAVLLAAGVWLWSVYDGPMYVRAGFSENIYPPTLAYVATSVGEILLLMAILDWRPDLPVYRPLQVYGESSLFMYWFHYALIGLLRPMYDVRLLFTLFVIVLVFLVGVAYGLRFVRRRWPHRPGIIRHVLGI